jgi:hypothetical protein
LTSPEGLEPTLNDSTIPLPTEKIGECLRHLTAAGIFDTNK